MNVTFLGAGTSHGVQLLINACPELRLQALDTLVLGVLRSKPHETDFSFGEGLAIVEQLKHTRAFFTHIAHQLDHESTNKLLPPHVRLAYDGLRISV